MISMLDHKAARGEERKAKENLGHTMTTEREGQTISCILLADITCHLTVMTLISMAEDPATVERVLDQTDQTIEWERTCTLKEEEINDLRGKIVKKLKKQLDADLRS